MRTVARLVIGVSKFSIKIRTGTYRLVARGRDASVGEMEQRQLLFEYKTGIRPSRAKYRGGQPRRNRVTNESPAFPVNYHFPEGLCRFVRAGTRLKRKGNVVNSFDIVRVSLFALYIMEQVVSFTRNVRVRSSVQLVYEWKMARRQGRTNIILYYSFSNFCDIDEFTTLVVKSAYTCVYSSREKSNYNFL